MCQTIPYNNGAKPWVWEKGLRILTIIASAGPNTLRRNTILCLILFYFVTLVIITAPTRRKICIAREGPTGP